MIQPEVSIFITANSTNFRPEGLLRGKFTPNPLNLYYYSATVTLNV